MNTFHHEALNRIAKVANRLKVPNLHCARNLDKYLALSLLQKSIRRNEFQLAWNASSYLLKFYPETFWKRLQVIALEDVGVADLELVLATLMIAKKQNSLASKNNYLSLAWALVSELCSSKKDRSADDLFDVLDRDTSLADKWADIIEGNQRPESATDDIILQSIVFAVSAGADGPGTIGKVTRSKWKSLLLAQQDLPTRSLALECAIVGMQNTGSVLAPLLYCVATTKPQSAPIVDDVFPATSAKSFPPIWTLGLHTRVGLSGFRKYLARSSRFHSLFQNSTSGDVSGSKTVGGLVFRLSCGQLRNRWDTEISRTLKTRATNLGWGIVDQAVPEAMEILSDEFDLLDDCRHQALKDFQNG